MILLQCIQTPRTQNVIMLMYIRANAVRKKTSQEMPRFYELLHRRKRLVRAAQIL